MTWPASAVANADLDRRLKRAESDAAELRLALIDTQLSLRALAQSDTKIANLLDAVSRRLDALERSDLGHADQREACDRNYRELRDDYDRLNRSAGKQLDAIAARLDALERTDPGHRIAEAIRAHRFDRAGELPGFTTGMRTAAFIADDITGNDPVKTQEEQT